jgi:ABC-2 type transport system ATP-binding protein
VGFVSILSVDTVTKRFGDVDAVHDVSFEARAREILGFLGPNGAGKTTTLRMIMGILRPDAGTIRFGAEKAQRVPKARIGYLPEERGLYDDARVLDMLLYLGGLKGIPREEAQRRAEGWLDRLDLADWSRRKVGKLSKGMQQKVQFIATVLHDPELVVFDEPFSGLDPVFQDLFAEIIREQRDEGVAVLLSSHQMNRVEALCDRIVLIHKGREVLRGRLEEIKEAAGIHVAWIRYDGDASFLREMDGLSDLRLDEGTATFVLEEGLSPDAFLRGLPPTLVVRELSIERPPLHDLFVRAVEGGDAR